MKSLLAKEERPRLIQIYDPVAGYNYTLDPRKLIAHRVAVETLGARPEKTQKSVQTGNADPKPPLSGLQSAGSNSLRKNNMNREPLGTRTIDGIEAEGWRTTITIPAGAMGSDKPITPVCETWHATELKALVLSKCSDPRSGKLTRRLKNLDRAEPDASLFEVPPDYTIVEDKDRFTISEP